MTIDYDKAREYGHYDASMIYFNQTGTRPVRFMGKAKRATGDVDVWAMQDKDGDESVQVIPIEYIIPVPQVRRVWIRETDYNGESLRIDAYRTEEKAYGLAPCLAVDVEAKEYILAEHAARSCTTEELKAELAKRGVPQVRRVWVWIGDNGKDCVSTYPCHPSEEYIHAEDAELYLAEKKRGES